MALLNEVQSALLKFVAQLGLDYQTVGSAVLVSLAAGVAFNFLIHIPFTWVGLIPLWFFAMNRYYVPMHKLPLDHGQDGTYDALRAAGLSRPGYLLASGLLFALALLVLTVPFFLALAGLSAGRIGPGYVLVVALLLFPWLVCEFYFLTAHIVETCDALAIEFYTRLGLGIPLGIIVVRASAITSIVAVLVTCIYYIAPGLLPGLWRTAVTAAALWPLWVLLSWGLFVMWIVWLARETHRQ